MNKVTELLDAVGGVITCVRNLADSLQVVADVLADMKSFLIIQIKRIGMNTICVMMKTVVQLVYMELMI